MTFRTPLSCISASIFSQLEPSHLKAKSRCCHVLSTKLLPKYSVRTLPSKGMMQFIDAGKSKLPIGTAPKVVHNTHSATLQHRLFYCHNSKPCCKSCIPARSQRTMAGSIPDCALESFAQPSMSAEQHGPLMRMCICCNLRKPSDTLE